MSLRSHTSKRAHFSREGFSPISNEFNMPGTNDAAIDIPLEQVPTGALRNQDSSAALRPTASHGEQRLQHRGNRDSRFMGRRLKTPPAGRALGQGYDGEQDTITTMGKVYDKIKNISIITRYMLYVAPLAACLAVPIIVGATAARHAKIAGVPIRWFFTWIEVVWVSLWLSKIVAHFLPYFFRIFAGVISSGVRKYSEVIKSLEIPLSLVGWSICSVATFVPIMTRNPYNRDPANKETGVKDWEKIVRNILGAAVCASLVFFGEKLIIQLISIDYHRKQFAFRIRESKHNIYLLSQLYEASRTLFPSYCNEFAEEDYIMSDQLNLKALGIHSKNHSHNRSGSATPGRILQDIGRYGDKLTSAFGNVAHEITGREVLNPNSAHSIVVTALEKKQACEALAKRIWMSFVVEGKDSLFQEDLMDVLGSDRRTEAEEAFAFLDKDVNGDISLDEMILVVTEMGRERKAITTSMHDVDQAINVLDNMLAVVVFVAVVFIFIAFLNKSFVTTLATAGTALLSLSFVFSVTCQEILGSCIFVFVKHPFDVGDRIDIGADQFIVEHISLLFTVFKRASGANCGRVVQIPNIVLNTLWVENISRSKAMTEQYEIYISFDTSFDDIQILKNELQTFVCDKDNSRDFQPDVEIGILGTTDQSKMQLQIEIRHKSNWANETVRQARRSKFMCALVAALRAVPIYGPGGGSDAQGSKAAPNYGVTITDQEAKEAAEQAKMDREKARLVPQKKIEEAKNNVSPVSSRKGGALARDNGVVDELTARDPASDPARDDAWTARDDTSTLGERPSIDRQDEQELKTMLRRESTRGKRKPSSDIPSLARPSVPAINEPSSHGQYSAAQPSSRGYENMRPGLPVGYRPQFGHEHTSYQSSLPHLTPTNPLEMSQVPSRTLSNPYRRSMAEGQSQTSNLSGQKVIEEELQDEDERVGTGSGPGNLRPYSGV
ncbi:Mechanosensitive ion channel MscS [Teratosphaeria destructans]|uniref:Mechanosensitive ion channel MscS n=1 Tax=Teratosphaeria destructans TaxID=418781 RepID=A0A9W7T1K7_9PEZI|nr:Mechanosensitive ion channel MscS [Teratosphaeria destructans]